MAASSLSALPRHFVSEQPIEARHQIPSNRQLSSFFHCSTLSSTPSQRTNRTSQSSSPTFINTKLNPKCLVNDPPRPVDPPPPLRAPSLPRHNRPVQHRLPHQELSRKRPRTRPPRHSREARAQGFSARWPARQRKYTHRRRRRAGRRELGSDIFVCRFSSFQECVLHKNHEN
jgi:hypothetical protein